MCLHLGDLIFIGGLEVTQLVDSLTCHFGIFLCLHDRRFRVCNVAFFFLKLGLKLLELSHACIVRLFLEERLLHDDIELVLKSISVLPSFQESLPNVFIFRCSRFQSTVLHSQRVCLIEGSFELILERLLIVFTLAKNVLFHFKGLLDVFHPALGLHAFKLFFSAFTKQFFHV